MSYLFTYNQTPVSNADAMLMFKTLMKSAGWTVPRSSDGLTFNAAGDQITTNTSGAGGMNNANAWFVLQAPGAVDGYTRQLLFFRDNSGTTLGNNWFIQYSVNAGFTGGGATTAPTATDSGNLLGTGKGTEATLFGATGGAYRWQIMADNATPYTFAAFAYPIGGGNATTFMMSDRMTAGSFPSQDNDPYVWFMSGYGTNHCMPFNSSGTNTQLSTDCSFIESSFDATKGVPYSWLKYGLAGQTFTQTPSLMLSQFNGNPNYSFAPFGAGSNPHSGNDDLFPLLYGRVAAAGGVCGYKGTSTLMQWCGAQRATADTVTVSTSSDHIVVNGAVVLPWNGTNPLI